MRRIMQSSWIWICFFPFISLAHSLEARKFLVGVLRLFLGALKTIHRTGQAMRSRYSVNQVCIFLGFQWEFKLCMLNIQVLG